jgi:hypothetical protein
VTPSELAYEAARLLSEHGHCKYELEDSQGRLCYAGAVFGALSGRRNATPGVAEITADGGDHALFTIVSNVVSGILSERGWEDGGPIRYNNAPGTTGEDVILLLKEAGAVLEEKEKHARV